MGLENFSRFLEPYGIKATLFMVGKDLQQPENIPYAADIVAAGHEIANHTFSHVQGFRLLSFEEKQSEIEAMEAICERVTGKRPVGFRSPGWNISDDTLEILKLRGYLYDSSIFPSSINPLLKFLHWWSMNGRTRAERTTLGHLHYMLAPTRPYCTNDRRLGRRGDGGFVEFPQTVTPIVRLPFFATFLLATGLELFKACYRMLRALRRPIQYQFHLSDFVDYNHPELDDQVPSGNGVYIPQALKTPLSRKWELFTRALDIMAADYTYTTLESWAKRLLEEKV
jgi:hypothetical protein